MREALIYIVSLTVGKQRGHQELVTNKWIELHVFMQMGLLHVTAIQESSNPHLF